MKQETGLIFNIQKFSLHDGPGIRTTIFFKGCPLTCWWCQNPEGIDGAVSLLCREERCLHCGRCFDACPHSAIALGEDGPVIDRLACRACLRCSISCPTEALQGAGREVTVSEIVAEALQDRVVYEESSGGVTISGGEPLMQPVFLCALLQKLKESGIHTAVETAGYAPRKVVAELAQWTDLLIYDLKLTREEMSMKYCGVSPGAVIENLRYLARRGSNILVRMPLIPSVNDDENNLVDLARIMRECGLNSLELLPYHRLGENKYPRLGLKYRLAGTEEPTEAAISTAAAILEREGITLSGEVNG